jgi:predicted transcriptional regulator
VERLGGDHDLIARGEILQRAPEHLLADALGVHVSRVEEVDAQFDRALDERAAGLFVQHPRAPFRRAIGHGAEANP